MRNDDQKTSLILSVCGILPVVWLALLTAPYVSGGLVEIIRGLPVAMGNPFEITMCEDSVKTVLTVIVAPITSRIHTKAKLPTHTLINDFEGLDKNSIILLEQIRTIDKQRLKQYLGMIPDNIVARVDKALAISVALEKTKATDV